MISFFSASMYRPYLISNMRHKNYQEIGSDHLPIIAEFAFTESLEDDSEEEDDSEQDDEPVQEVCTGQHVYPSDGEAR
jgi:hypothetical protein